MLCVSGDMLERHPVPKLTHLVLGKYWYEFSCYYDDVIKWKHFPRYWTFGWEIIGHRWRGALVFSLICAWTNGWVNNRDAGDLRRHRTQYDIIVMWLSRTELPKIIETLPTLHSQCHGCCWRGDPTKASAAIILTLVSNDVRYSRLPETRNQQQICKQLRPACWKLLKYSPKYTSNYKTCNLNRCLR